MKGTAIMPARTGLAVMPMIETSIEIERYIVWYDLWWVGNWEVLGLV